MRASSTDLPGIQTAGGALAGQTFTRLIPDAEPPLNSQSASQAGGVDLDAPAPPDALDQIENVDPQNDPQHDPQHGPLSDVKTHASPVGTSLSVESAPLMLLASSEGGPQVTNWDPSNLGRISAPQAALPNTRIENALPPGTIETNAILNPLANPVTVLPVTVEVPRTPPPAALPPARASNSPASGTSASPKESTLPTLSTDVSPTPFAVFFSERGSATESAASLLPKMILPLGNAALHDGSISSPGSIANLQNGAANSTVAPNLSVQPGKAAPANQSDNLAGSPLRRDANSNSLNTSLATAGSTNVSTNAANSLSSPQAPPLVATAQPVNAPALSLTFSPPLSPSSAPSDLSPRPDPASAEAALANPLPATAQFPPTTLPGPVQVAQIVTRVGQAEMRIGMNTSAFGNVEVRTTVHSIDVGLIIGSEKGDLRGLLTNEMPALTNSLQQQNLRLNSVNFTQAGSFSNNMSGGGDSQQRSFVPQPSTGSLKSVPPGAALTGAAVTRANTEYAWAEGNLSILA